MLANLAEQKHVSPARASSGACLLQAVCVRVHWAPGLRRFQAACCTVLACIIAAASLLMGAVVQFYDWMKETTEAEEAEMRAHGWDLEDVKLGPAADRYRQPSLLVDEARHEKLLEDARDVSDAVNAFNDGQRVRLARAATRRSLLSAWACATHCFGPVLQTWPPPRSAVCRTYALP